MINLGGPSVYQFSTRKDENKTQKVVDAESKRNT